MTDRAKEALEMFIEELGRTDNFREVSQYNIDKYRDKIPDTLLEYWKLEGFRAYENGMVWITNPEEYDKLVQAYLENTPFEPIDTFHAVFRGAFGDIRAVGESTGGLITISVPYNNIIALKKNFKKKQNMDDKNRVLQSTFVMVRKDKYDYYDIKTNQSLFDQAYEKFGMLEADEVYAFKKPLCDGGVPTIDNIEVQNIFEYIINIRALGTPKVPFSGIRVDTENMRVSKS